MPTELPTSDELQTLLEKLVAEHECPGASAAVGQGDLVAVAASGVLNLNTGVEVTTDSLFQIGSNTKVYNATMIMQLVDEGRIDLDEKAVTYLPKFRLADAEATKQITVRHLLTHTSGIDGGDYIADFGRGDDAIARFVASLAEKGLVHPIGRFRSYCNAATVVAGRIIEVVSAKTWHQVLNEQLLTPLGLDHTVSLPEEALLFRVAAGHLPDPDNDDTVRVFPTWMLPHATAPAGSAINASAADLVAFGQFHLRDGQAGDGTRVLSEAGARAMREPQFPETDTRPGQSQGLGWFLAEQGPFKVVTHGGGTFGQNSQFLILPEFDTTIAVLTNGPGGGAVGSGIVKDVLTRLGGEDTATKIAAQEAERAGSDGGDVSDPAVDVDLTKYAGTYRRTGLTTTIEVKDGELVAQTVLEGYLAQMPPHKPMTLKPLEATEFMAYDEKGKPTSPVRFEDLDDEGRPTYFIMGRVARRVV